MENQRKFFDELAQEVEIKNLDDWYKVSTLDVLEFGGAGFKLEIFTYFISYVAALLQRFSI